MQEPLLLPAHPVAFGFGPGPLGFGDRRLCSPSVLLPCGDARFYGGGGGYTPFTPSPSPSPHGYGGGGYTLFPIPRVTPRGDGLFYGGVCTPFTPSTTRASPRGANSPFTPSPTRAPPRGATSPSNPSSSGSRVDDDAAAAEAQAASEHRMRLARLALQYRDAANRYELCISQLADTAREAAALRLQNSELRVANNDLAGRFAMLGGNQGAAIALAEQLRRLHLGQMQAMPAHPMLPMVLPASPARPMLPMALHATPAVPMLPIVRPASQAPPMLSMAHPASPAPPMLRPMARPASPAEKLAVLPKSISIRSTGYMQMTRNAKHRVAKPVNVGSQRVFVGVDGAKPEEQKKGRDREKGQVVKSIGGLEFEAYSQGMFKTELCNKWEETGACRYGDHCQFAHGIAELRPVIRHPRYKTQVCRMVIGGAGCPYGHRCHFRHSINPADHQLLIRA